MITGSGKESMISAGVGIDVEDMTRLGEMNGMLETKAQRRGARRL